MRKGSICFFILITLFTFAYQVILAKSYIVFSLVRIIYKFSLYNIWSLFKIKNLTTQQLF